MLILAGTYFASPPPPFKKKSFYNRNGILPTHPPSIIRIYFILYVCAKSKTGRASLLVLCNVSL